MTDTIEIKDRTYIMMPKDEFNMRIQNAYDSGMKSMYDQEGLVIMSEDEFEQRLSDSYHAGAWNEGVRNRKIGRNDIL